jgi:hypothetical protein
MKSILKIVLLICVFAFNANAQTYFNKLYDYDNSNTYNNAASTGIEMSNGDFLLSTTKFYSFAFGALHYIRINSNGDTLYSKRYPKPNCAYYTGTSGSLIRCFDNNLIQTGYYYDTALTYSDVLLVKLNENGDTLWTKTYGGADNDYANVVCQTPDSGFVLMGGTQSYSTGAASDFYMIKTDSLGNFLWQKVYGTTAAEDCISGQITLDGGFILSGRQSNMFHIVKTDSYGNFQWQQTYSGTQGVCFIKQLADSTYILAGAKNIAGLGDQACIIKINKTGGIIWQKDYGGTVNDWLYSTPIILGDGSIILSGQSMLGSDPIGLLIKVDSLGNQKWLRTYYANPSNANYFYDVKQTNDNGFIMVGSGNVTGQDAWAVKVDSNGCEVANCNVGVEEFQISDFKLKIYPNPASSEINISINGEDLNNYEISIVNVLGEEQKIERNLGAISISHLAKGLYFVSTISKDGKYYLKEKFVKE